MLLVIPVRAETHNACVNADMISTKDAQGYTVDQEKLPASAAQASQAPPAAEMHTVNTPAPAPATNNPTPAATATAPVSATGEKTAAPQSKEAKKASIWARCCGSSKDYAQ